MKKVAFLVLLNVVLIGCTTMGAMEIPGQTTASATLRVDVFKMIKLIENAQAPGCSPKVIDTKVTNVTEGAVNEAWTVKSCEQTIIYPVTFTPDPNGGTYFGVTTPEKRS